MSPSDPLSKTQSSDISGTASVRKSSKSSPSTGHTVKTNPDAANLQTEKQKSVVGNFFSNFLTNMGVGDSNLKGNLSRLSGRKDSSSSKIKQTASPSSETGQKFVEIAKKYTREEIVASHERELNKRSEGLKTAKKEPSASHNTEKYSRIDDDIGKEIDKINRYAVELSKRTGIPDALQAGIEREDQEVMMLFSPLQSLCYKAGRDLTPEQVGKLFTKYAPQLNEHYGRAMGFMDDWMRKGLEGRSEWA